MSQLSLFTAEKKPVERRSNPAFVRKHLTRLVRTARDAVRMPWSEGEAQSWENQFPELAKSLEPEEGAALVAAFAAELRRLRSAMED